METHSLDCEMSWLHGVMVGAIPSAAMLAASLILLNYEISTLTEACFQNLCAGLIIAACGGELMPLVTASGTPIEQIIGLTSGFAIFLSMIYGIDYFTNAADEGDEGPSSKLASGGYQAASADEWDLNLVLASAIAMNDPVNRASIHRELREIEDAVEGLHVKSGLILQEGLPPQEYDAIEDEIDADIHNLQFRVDATRRHLEGSGLTGSVRNQAALTADQKLDIHFAIVELKDSVDHIIKHVQFEEMIDHATMTEIHDHITDLNSQVARLHKKMDSVVGRWHRSRHALIRDTQLGEVIPIKLVLPVVIDAMTDGFLVGITCAVSARGGLILALANCVEMSFLGIAFSSRIVKCTGSSSLARGCTAISPPIAMMIMSGIGAFIGGIVKHIPIMFITFASSGIVALLFLVCNELIIEAKEAQGGKERWWVSIMVFIGVWFVLVMNIFLPADSE